MPAKPIITAPDRKLHMDELADLMAKIWPWPDYYTQRDRTRRCYLGSDHSDWQTSRVALLDGRIVSHWGVFNYRMRVGSARLKMAGVGGVVTHGDYRKRGLQNAVARASIRAMEPAGYDMSWLFGIQDFYHRFGYVRGACPVTFTVDLAKLPAPAAAPKLRKLAMRNRPDLIRMYNRQNSRLTGTAVRPTFPEGGVKWKGYLWTDPAGELAGYVITQMQDEKFTLIESGGNLDDILAATAKLARREHARKVHIVAHYDSKLAKRLRCGNCKVEIGYYKNANEMVRIINLRSTLTKLCGEFARRLKRTALAGWRGELLIADPREAVTLKFNRGKVRVIEPGQRTGRTNNTIRGGEKIAQLLVGTHEPQETVEAAGIRLTGEASMLLDTLFPAQHPRIDCWDSF